MGASNSTQSISDTVNASTSVATTVANSCISYLSADNQIAIDGNGNYVGKAVQSIHASVNAPCVTTALSSTSIAATVAATAGQTANETSIAGTQWLDNSSNSVHDNVTDNLTNVVQSTSTQTCLVDLNTSNAIAVAGDGNTIVNTVQSSTSDMVSKCVMNSSDTMSAASAATNTSNQYLKTQSENPFAFLGDCMVAIFAMGFGALILLCIIGAIFGAIYYFMFYRQEAANGTAPTLSGIMNAIRPPQPTKADL